MKSTLFGWKHAHSSSFEKRFCIRRVSTLIRGLAKSSHQWTYTLLRKLARTSKKQSVGWRILCLNIFAVLHSPKCAFGVLVYVFWRKRHEIHIEWHHSFNCCFLVAVTEWEGGVSVTEWEGVLMEEQILIVCSSINAFLYKFTVLHSWTKTSILNIIALRRPCKTSPIPGRLHLTKSKRFRFPGGFGEVGYPFKQIPFRGLRTYPSLIVLQWL